jgi:hypothetical protein
MPEWLDLALSRATLAPWRFELLLAATMMSFADYVTTTMFVKRAGPERESNPLLRWIMERWGIRGLWVFWVLVWTLMWGLIDLSGSTALFLLLFFSAHVINNLIVLKSLSDEQYAEG